MIHITLIILLVTVAVYFILRHVYRKSEVKAFADKRSGLIDGDFFKTVRLTKRTLQLDIAFYGTLLVYAAIFGVVCASQDYSAWALLSIFVAVPSGMKMHRVYYAYVKYCITVEEICKQEFGGDENVYRSKVR